MFNKNIITWSLVILGLIVSMIVFKSLFPILFFIIALLGWIIVGALVISLTGLQNTIFKSFNKSGGLVVSKKIKIPFVGEGEVSSVSGTEIIFKLKRK